MLTSIVMMVVTGERELLVVRLPGVPVSALRKDLVMERPPRTYSAAPSHMALA